MADVLDGRGPGQTVIKIGNHAHIDAPGAGLRYQPLHNSALARPGHEYFVDKVSPNEIAQLRQAPEDFPGTELGRLVGVQTVRYGLDAVLSLNEPLESEPQVANPLQMAADGEPGGTGSDNQHVASVNAAFVSFI